MSDITDLILSEYYGFGVDKTDKKCISSYEATYDPNIFHRSSDTNDLSDIETPEEASGHGTSIEVKRKSITSIIFWIAIILCNYCLYNNCIKNIFFV